MKRLYVLLAFSLAFSTLAFSQNYSLFGAAYQGGSTGRGTMFQYNLKSHTFNTTVNFNDTNSEYPIYGSFVLDSATNLAYGAIYNGGMYNSGAILSYGSCTGGQIALNLKCNQPNGSYPEGAFTYCPKNGLFYGTTYEGGTYNLGAIFSFNPNTNKYTKIADFNGSNGSYPDGSLTWDPNTNLFYGLAADGGTSGYGTLFSVDPSTGTLTYIFSFTGANGEYPYNSLTYNPVNKYLYGMAYDGGTGNVGVLFFYNPATGKDSTLVSLTSTLGTNPEDNFVFNPIDSLLYGMTSQGGINNYGTIFSYNPKTGQDSIRGSLGGNLGEYGYGTFIFNPNDSLLYGTAYEGGTNGYGTIVRFNPHNNYDTAIYNFNSNTGDYPYAGVTLDTVSNTLYGVTVNGGTYGYGALYRYKLNDSTYDTLVNFNDTNGAYPYGDLIIYKGKLFGTAYDNLDLGSSNGPGLLFSYDTATHKQSVVYTFTFSSSENYPYNIGLNWNSSKKLYYAMSSYGGIYNGGTIFSFDPVTKKDSVYVSFGGDSAGYYPYGSFTYCPTNGLYYAATTSGGTNGYGSIFSFNPATGKDSVWHEFNSGSGGYSSYGSLLFNPANGLLYGTTSSGGANSYGTIFTLDPSTGTYSDVYDFAYNPDGAYPYSGLTLNTVNGMLYGTTEYGGSGYGTVYRFNPATNKDSVIATFSNAGGPEYTYGKVTMDPSDSLLYGISYQGGTSGGYGTLYMLNLHTGKDSVLHSFNYSDGGYSESDLLLVNMNPSSVTVSNDTTVCSGSNITLKASATGTGVSYAWSTGATTSSISVVPNADTTYSVNICHGVFGKDTSVVITVNPSPTVMVTGKDTIINGSTDTLSASGAITYMWNTSSTKDSVFVSPTTNTTYTVTGTGANGCSTVATFTVVVKTITGIQPINSSSASVYPNPASQTMNLTFSMKGSANAVIEVMNMAGEVVMKTNTSISNGETMSFDISSLAPGVYFAHIAANNQTQVVKFIKQ